MQAALGIMMLVGESSATYAQNPEVNAAREKVRCIALEIYTRSSDPKLVTQVEAVQKLIESKRGVKLKVHDLDQASNAQERLEKIAAVYKVSASELPLLYGMNGVAAGSQATTSWEKRLSKLLTMEVFTRQGCSRCASAKLFLPELGRRYPGLKIDILDVSSRDVNARYAELIAVQKIGGISFPGFWLCNQLLVGFDSRETFEPRFDTIMKRWSFDCEVPKLGLGSHPKSPVVSNQNMGTLPKLTRVSYHFSEVTGPDENEPLSEALQPIDPPPQFPAELSEPPELDIGNEPPGQSLSIPDPAQADIEDTATAVKIPWLGMIDAKSLGMPLFTVVVGLIDGFNPCAMWVLLFLLSVLVNLKDRGKILAVAGTFVVVSGLAYFAFMAAWLNVLMLVGILRWVQVVLACLAIVVGVIHIKDFFAFKKGISLSIPESAKPGIYSRVRKIVMAEHLFGAIVGAFVLAVLVNIIELLCTAGLPALYSQVLTMQGYPKWCNYAYLGLYILAYMFDDTLMVAGVIITLGHRKLQENEGRWLKLFSGSVVLALGLVLLIKPDWLG